MVPCKQEVRLTPIAREDQYEIIDDLGSDSASPSALRRTEAAPHYDQMVRSTHIRVKIQYKLRQRICTIREAPQIVLRPSRTS